jgi:hypothetical protein
MLALKDNCLHPLSQKPYIKSSLGGLDNSIEGLQVRWLRLSFETVYRNFGIWVLLLNFC